MGPIDQFGNQTPTWYFMQHVNLQIQKLAPTLLQLTSDAVYHFGKAPAGASGPPTNSLVTGAGGDSFLVGDFTHRDGSRYVMIVNKDLAKSRVCSPQFRQAPRRRAARLRLQRRADALRGRGRVARTRGWGLAEDRAIRPRRF